jgi:hypothetical protein
VSGQEGLSDAKIDQLVEQVRNNASDRKKRLFACACFRRFWPVLVELSPRLPGGPPSFWFDQLNGWVPAALDASEQFADGLISKQQLRATRGSGGGPWNIAWNICRTDANLALEVIRGFDTEIRDERSGFPFADEVCNLLRDIFGDPFRSGWLTWNSAMVPAAAIDPDWLTWNHATVPAIARHIYDDRAFHDLPILADALEDAGCTNADLLDHCRGPGPHVRGCWAVDLLLVKT